MVGVLKLHSVFDKFLRYPALRAARRALTQIYIPMVMNRIFMEYYKKCDRRNFIPRYEYRSILEDKDGDVKKLS